MIRTLEKHQYWIWLLILFLLWGRLLLSAEASLLEMPWRIIGASLFYTVFFLVPVCKGKDNLLLILFLTKILLLTFTLWEGEAFTPDHSVLLLYIITAGAATFYLKELHTLAVGFLAGFCGYFVVPDMDVLLFVIYVSVTAMALFLYQRTSKKEEELRHRGEALFSEYRKMKRDLVSGEKAVRQQERTQIAREIHDAVGHKLTALLMQLEVFRMKSSPEVNQDVETLKQLARESLEETRNAVKTLKQEESGGLPAVIQLIRKLEAESLIRIQFTVRHGALTAALSNAQAIAVYRAVQEALTNAMKHGSEREVKITLEAPGKAVFRFEVENPVQGKASLHKGFGLKSMQERMEAAGGKLEITPYPDKYIIRGSFTLMTKEESI
ncbi:sensor histidine kinase [Alkalicoccus daliensis]|uniref:histidine kinase n=1 Tax=Alkalicoccus daliensis TaxID=745820 RepID=A0A1H0DSC5_9BACI|nr:sensor histidine kinase [Alkalicoccus daliensis]SDN73062.1 Signal transduction histidine kinase [Alkalicoccus daliensis]